MPSNDLDHGETRWARDRIQSVSNFIFTNFHHQDVNLRISQKSCLGMLFNEVRQIFRSSRHHCSVKRLLNHLELQITLIFVQGKLVSAKSSDLLYAPVFSFYNISIVT